METTKPQNLPSTAAGAKRWETAFFLLLPVLSVGLAVRSVQMLLVETRGAAVPSPAGARDPGSLRAANIPHQHGRGISVEEQVARAIARAKLRRPGGMVIANPHQLADTPVGTRFLAGRHRDFTSYRDFVRRFGTGIAQRPAGERGVLLIQGHGGNGIGLETEAPLGAITLPPGVPRPRRRTVGEMAALGRVRADIGSRWDLIILGQCNPRACLRSLEADIPIDRELLHSFRVARWPADQLRVVRNLREDVFLLGDRVVGRKPYAPPRTSRPLARVIAPDVIGCQDSAEAPEGSSMTDVFILAGRWTDRPTPQKSRRELAPSDAMIIQADRQVRKALAAQLRAGPRSLTSTGRRRPGAAAPRSS